MSILTTSKDKLGNVSAKETKLTPAQVLKGTYMTSGYTPSAEESEMRAMILRHFTLGYTTMYTPRVEFNDLSVIQRMTVDQMSFNTYQPNNGQPAAYDDVQAWRSRAMRPIVRNKAVSIAAHATATLVFPKVFAYNEDNDQQNDAAMVIEDLMEWAADQSNYASTALRRTISALSDPASIGYTEYCEVYRSVKRPNENGSYTTEMMLDETLSGFQDTPVSVDELFIENFYEPDIQKQAWLVWRRVCSYSLAEAKYKNKYDNFKHVYPGIQILLNDANQSFYQVYDTNMRQTDVEEIIYWNRALDVKIILVNGVMLTSHDNPNPRNDKLYPFDKFGYELINNRCFYYKSLAFKLQQDADIINTLYPMIIDATYLNLMPPMVQIGDEIIGSDVIVPGAVTNLQAPNADLRAISTSNNLTAGINALAQVETSINDSTQSLPTFSGRVTAYQMSIMQQNASTVLGLFVQMIAQHVRDFGKLRLGDILQYLTIADADKITADAPLVYKTFLMRDRSSDGTQKTRKIQFDGAMPDDTMSGEDQLSQSYDALSAGDATDMEIWRANPRMVRELKYMVTVSPDAITPRSRDLEKQFDLETYDRAIMNPVADQEEIYKLLLSTNDTTRKDPDKYIAKQQNPVEGLSQQQMAPAMGSVAGPMQQKSAQPALPGPGGQPSPYPQTASVGQLR